MHPCHVRKVTRSLRSVIVIDGPAVFQAMIFHKDPFNFHNPRLADHRASTLKERVKGTVSRPYVDLAAIKTLDESTLPLDVELTGHTVERLGLDKGTFETFTQLFDHRGVLQESLLESLTFLGTLADDLSDLPITCTI